MSAARSLREQVVLLDECAVAEERVVGKVELDAIAGVDITKLDNLDRAQVA